MDERSDQPRLRLALSGGGHRATLFSLGVLLAVVDRGLNRRVEQIASVSGGSIANAAIACGCDYQDATSDEVWNIARQLIARVEQGVLTPSVIVAVITGAALPAAAVGVLVARIGHMGPLGVAIAVLAMFFAAFFLRGRVVEALLARRYFGSTSPRLGSLSRSAEHVFCATDLVRGTPVYFTTAKEGVVWQRPSGPSDGEAFRMSQLSLAAAVRASAAFPGIPPKRLRLRARDCIDRPLTFGGKIPTPTRHDRTALLSDGGIWNNLGTQVAREDELLHGEKTPSSSWMVIANASAPLRGQRGWMYQIPFLAELRLWPRLMAILNSNTVGPRVAAIENAALRHVKQNEQLPRHDALDIIVSLDQSPELVEMWVKRFDPQRRSTPLQQDWCMETGWAVASWFKNEPDRGQSGELFDLLMARSRMFPTSAHAGGFGIIDQKAIEDVSHTSWFASVRDLAEKGSRVPTTLGRIKGDVARGLVARAYANTILATLLIERFDYREHQILAGAAARLQGLSRLRASD